MKKLYQNCKQNYKKNEGKICVALVMLVYLNGAINDISIANEFHIIIAFCSLLLVAKYVKEFFAKKSQT